MSLLDDVSIVVTPNGYKAGELYAVVPSSGAADMDVTRATAATRVDEAGLVNYAEIIGSEEIKDGNFPTPNTAWSGDASTVFAEGSATLTMSGGYANSLIQTSALESGKLYSLTYTCDLSGVTSGTLKFQQFSDASLDRTVLDGTNTIELNSNGTSFLISEGGANGTAIFTNISVKEVTRDNVPRIDYTGGGCPHILAEPQRTNLVTNSEVFTDSSWTLSGTGASVTTNTIISPDGTQNADTLTAGSNFGQLQQVHSGTSGIQYTGSIYIKRKTGTGQVNIRVAENTNTPITVTSSWARYDFTATSTSTTIRMGVKLATPTDEIYIWGAQIEEGSFPTSYIPTSGSTVTRNQDQFTRDGIGSLINSTEGVLFVEMAFSDAGRLAILNSDASDDQVVLGFSGTVFCRIRENGANVVTQFVSSANQLNTYYKIAVKYKSGNSAIWVDGNETAVAGTFTLNDLSKILFISEGSRTYGKVKQLQVYKTDLTDEQLLQLTGTSGTDFYESYAEMASALTYTIQ